MVAGDSTGGIVIRLRGCCFTERPAFGEGAAALLPILEFPQKGVDGDGVFLVPRWRYFAYAEDDGRQPPPVSTSRISLDRISQPPPSGAALPPCRLRIPRKRFQAFPPPPRSSPSDGGISSQQALRRISSITFAGVSATTTSPPPSSSTRVSTFSRVGLSQTQREALLPHQQTSPLSRRRRRSCPRPAMSPAAPCASSASLDPCFGAHRAFTNACRSRCYDVLPVGLVARSLRRASL